MKEATKEFLKKNEEYYEKRKKEILESKDELVIKGTTYYVSTDGDDYNDGLSPETPWKTLDRVTTAWLHPGDGVLFKRGDLFRGEVKCKEGVSYGAYGEGPKPKVYGWIEDMADSSLWELVDSEHNIWKYTKPICDVGTLVFNDGEAWGRKLIPSYKNLQFVCREDESKVFEIKNEMTNDLDLYWHFDTILTTIPVNGQNFPVPNIPSEVDPDYFGDLYLRCDKGNPGKVFKSIEAIAFTVAFRAIGNDNITIDNICMKFHKFGITGGRNPASLHVTNCEIGWIGGHIMNYKGNDPNYPQGKRGTVTRYGNGVEIYGNCNDYIIANTYVYQVFDAGMSHQVTTYGEDKSMKKVRYIDNVIEKCVYGIEYFLEQRDCKTNSLMEDIVMKGNIIRLSGYGWGQQRHNVHTPAHIKGWSYDNPAKDYVIEDNILDRCAYKMVHLVAEKQEYCPKMNSNTYIQYLGDKLGRFGGKENGEPEYLVFDENAEEKINEIFGEKNAEVYYIKK